MKKSRILTSLILGASVLIMSACSGKTEAAVKTTTESIIESTEALEETSVESAESEKAPSLSHTNQNLSDDTTSATEATAPETTAATSQNQALSHIKGFEDMDDNILLAIKNYHGSPIRNELCKINNFDQKSTDFAEVYILLTPCHNGSTIRLESVNYESDGIFSTKQIIKEVLLTPDDYALLVGTNLPDGMPMLRATVEYDGQTTEYLFSSGDLSGPDLPRVVTSDTMRYVQYGTYGDTSPSEVSIYSADDLHMGFESEEVVLTAFTPEALIDAIIATDILPVGIRVQSIATYEANGKKFIDLDLSDEFYEHFIHLGTTGEYITAGIIWNTFLDAYEADQLKITVNGSGFDSGHAGYWEYMGHFGD